MRDEILTAIIQAIRKEMPNPTYRDIEKISIDLLDWAKEKSYLMPTKIGN